MTEEQRKFVRDLRRLADACREDQNGDWLRTLAIRNGDYEYAWYNFDEVLFESREKRGKYHYQTVFSRHQDPEPRLYSRIYALKAGVFRSNFGEVHEVPFTPKQQRYLKRLGLQVDFRPPVIRIRDELHEVGVRLCYWVFEDENISSIGFFKEADAVLARVMIDDFEWDPIEWDR